MSKSFVFRPLVAFPRSTTFQRRESRFSADVSQTLTLLNFELDKIKAQNAVVQVGKTADDFRNDGTPRTKYVAPPVVLSFEREGKAISMPCDTFLDWRDNLRAIALSLEALRAVDRYGVTQSGEQYRGWEALSAPQPTESEEFLDRDEAAKWLKEFSGISWVVIFNNPTERERAYRIAARKLHPDAGGDAAQFRKLQIAKKILDNGQ